MSLINDMLRDLDARRVHAGTGSLATLPAASMGSVDVHLGISRLLAGLGMLAAVAITLPLLTDHLEIFDWGGPGGPAVTQTIALPAPAKKRTARQARRQESRTRSLRHPAVALAPAVAQAPPAVADKASPAELEKDTAKVSGSAGIQADELTAESIVLRNHGTTGHEYRLAAREAAAGNDQDAIQQLEHLLVSDTDHHEARLLLASLYIQQQQFAQAESLLADALASQPLHVPYARLLANLLAADNRHGEAIMHLLTALPGASRDATYHALLAGLYQHTGEPAAAASYFSSALALSPDHGKWWMGLGVSQEQAGERAAAHTAYNKALEFRLDASLRNFIGERLRQLKQNGTTGSTNIESQGKG